MSAIALAKSQFIDWRVVDFNCVAAYLTDIAAGTAVAYKTESNFHNPNSLHSNFSLSKFDIVASRQSIILLANDIYAFWLLNVLPSCSVWSKSCANNSISFLDAFILVFGSSDRLCLMSFPLS